MVPIYEQGQGSGIGYSFDRFIGRFIEVCENHNKSDRAKAFAFILYDFDDGSVREILKDLGGFARLDRLSGKDLSIFYLHSENKELIDAFNNIFFGAFDIKNEYNLPLVLFFNIVDGDVANVEVVEIERTDIKFAFGELYGIIENYIKKMKDSSVEKTRPKVNKVTEYLKTVPKIAIDRFVKIVTERASDYLGQYL